MLKLRLKHVVVAAGLGFATMAVAVVPAHAAPAPTAPAAAQFYTVQAGDYLSGIAVKLGVSLRDLLNANSLTASSLIYPGMKLTVPAGGTLPSTGGGNQGGGPLVYTVQAGDYLSGIAVKLKVRLADLLTLNRMTTTSVIHPGMKLTVPPGGSLPTANPPSSGVSAPVTSNGLVYTVVAGDTLIGIAGKTKVSLSSLLTLNKMTTSSLIYPGLRMAVPAGGVVPAAKPPQGSAPAPSNGTGAVPAKVQRVLDYALAQQGKPYVFFTSGPATFDCSGLPLAAFAQIGITLPHYSGYQARYGTAVDWTTSDIRPGDLVFLESYPGSGVINHVGIAVSSTQYVHAPRSGDVVRVGSIPFYRVVSVRRLVEA